MTKSLELHFEVNNFKVSEFSFFAKKVTLNNSECHYDTRILKGSITFMRFYLLSFQIILHLLQLVFIENAIGIFVVFRKDCLNFSINMTASSCEKRKI